jgi:hypothetical protein
MAFASSPTTNCDTVHLHRGGRPAGAATRGRPASRALHPRNSESAPGECLVKHVAYVEGVWFDQAISGHTYAHIGIPTSPARTFTLTKHDTIASVQVAHRRRCELSPRTMAALSLDGVVDGRGPRPVWALQLQVPRELAQHAGHADILREQILDRRGD